MPWPRSLTIGGLPGTGTTTACRTLHERSGLPYVYVGQIFRDLAREHGMSLAEFGAHAEEEPKIDRELDERQAKLLRDSPHLMEGRLSGYVAYRDRIPAFKVWVTCDAHERARRVVEREGGDVDQRMHEMRQREASERKRYLQYYGYDLNDLSVYDLVLDTSRLDRDAVVSAIEEAYHASLRPRRRWLSFLGG